MRLNRRGPLKTHEVMGDPQKPVIILFHGYGADAMDLASLADVTPGLRRVDLDFSSRSF